MAIRDNRLDFGRPGSPDIDPEAAILGCMIHSPPVCSNVFQVLADRHFQNPAQ